MAISTWESDILAGDIDWQRIIDGAIEKHGLDTITINGIKFVDLEDHPIYADINNFSKKNIVMIPPFDRLQGLIAYNNTQDVLRFDRRFRGTGKLKEILNRDSDFTNNLMVMSFLQGLKHVPQPKSGAFLGGLVRSGGATRSNLRGSAFMR